ncbi:hypothetical protein KFE25_007537 [Diacronema lutheri]|uniref:TOG domain-containing protein n=1 Tax=Diacronema lutheri TaxID=2081491 RepID=A0A8J5XRD2_DIALT|nr:hypothetical protein KFE25_007537 [Diacronema lutheri]
MAESPLREVRPNVAVPSPLAELTAKPALNVDSLPIGAPTPNPFDDRPNGKAVRKKRAAAGDAIVDAVAPVNFEDMPVGAKASQDMLDEYPPGFTPPEEGFNQVADLPLEKRLVSKRWQERKSAYDELAAEAGTSPETVRAAHEAGLAKMVADANPFAQERALELVVVLARGVVSADDASRLAGSVMSSLCEKAMPSRPNVKSRAIEAALLLVQAGAGLSVQAACVGMGSHKVPKVVLAALELLALQICEFGPSAVELRGLVKPLGALGEGHKDKAVRDAALTCLVELRARAGEAAVAPALKDLKPACVAEYERLCTERGAADGREAPARQVRGAASADTAAALAGGARAPRAAGAAAAAGSGCAPRAPHAEAAVDEEVAEVAVLSTLPKGWSTKLSSAKWQERKDALDTLLAPLARAPRVPRREFHEMSELLRTLKRVIGTDANVNVVGSAVRAAGLLARALGPDFARLAKEYVPLLLDKCAEKNKIVCDALYTALDLVAASGAAAPADVAEWAASGLASKTPAVRLAAAEWLRRCASAPAAAGGGLGAPAARAFVGALLKATDDGASEVRTAAYAAIAAALAAAPADARADALLAGLDGTKRKALDRALAAVGGVGTGAVVTNSSACHTRPAVARAASAGGSLLSATSRAPPAPLARSNGATAKPKPPGRAASAGAGLGAAPRALAADGGGGGGGGAGKRVSEADLELPDGALLGEADVEARVRELVPGADGILQRLRSTAWKERLDAVDALADALCAAEAPALARDGATVDGVVALLARSPGWKEPMVAVSARIAAAIGALARAAGASLERATIGKAAPPLAERLADAKQRAAAADALMAIAESSGVALIGALVCRGARGHKNPKVALEAAAWLRAAAYGFGPRGGGAGLARAHGVCELLAEALSHRDAKVREAGVGAAVAVQRVALAAGSVGVLKALEPLLAPAHAAALNGALERELAEPLPPPTHGAALADGAAGGAAGSNARTGERAGDARACVAVGTSAPTAGGAPLRPLAARVSFVSEVPAATLAEMGSAAWKARLKAVASARDALRALGDDVRVDPNLGALAELLRARLADSNRTVAASAAELCGELARAIGRPSLPHAKAWAPALLALLADARPAARDAASAALGAMVAELSFEPFLPHARTALSADAGRAHVLALLARFVPAVRVDACSPELRALLPAVFTALATDKGEARVHAHALACALCASLGADVAEGALAELRPAEAGVVAPILRALIAEADARAHVPGARDEAEQPTPATIAGARGAERTEPTSGCRGNSAADGRASAVADVAGAWADADDGVDADELAEAAADVAAARAPFLALVTPVEAPARPATAGARARTPTPAAGLAHAPRAAASGGARPATAGAPARARAPSDGGGVALTAGTAPASAALLACARGKDARAKKELRVRWVHAAEGVPSSEAVDQLREQFAAVAPGALVGQLFAADFREHLAALVLLERELDAATASAAAAGAPPGGVSGGAFGLNLDLLTRWLALRLGGSANAAVVLRCASLLDKLLAALGDEGYSLTELEARSLLPALCAQLGANAEATRVRFRGLVRGACAVVAPPTVGAQLVEDLSTSRNAKARVECAEMLAWLAKEHGLAAAAPSRSLALAVSLAAAPDKRLRAAAAHLLKAAHDADQLPEALCDRSLSAKLKLGHGPQTGFGASRAPAAIVGAALGTASAVARAEQVQPQPSAVDARTPKLEPPSPRREQHRAPAQPAPPAHAIASRGDERADSRAVDDALRVRRPSAALAISASPLLAPSSMAAARARAPPAQPAAAGGGDGSTLAALTCALYGHGAQDEAARIAALHELVEQMKHTAHAELRAHADSLFAAMLACLRASRPLPARARASAGDARRTPEWAGTSEEASPAGSAAAGESVRWRKHILNALQVVATMAGIVRALSDAAARDALATLLECLIDVHANEAEITAGAHMLKSLNMLVLQMLDELPRTRLATTLLALLADSAPGHGAAGAAEPADGGAVVSTPRAGSGHAHLCALVLKSLDKVTFVAAAAEAGSAHDADLDARAVLVAVVGFLRAHYALGSEAPSPAPSPKHSPTASPRRGGGSLGRRAREAARALAVQAMRVGGLTLDDAVRGMNGTDAFLLRRCLEVAPAQGDGGSSRAHAGTAASLRVGGAQLPAPPTSARARTRSAGTPTAIAEPPCTPLARALVDAVAHHSISAPPSSARLARSVANARTRPPVPQPRQPSLAGEHARDNSGISELATRAESSPLADASPAAAVTTAPAFAQPAASRAVRHGLFTADASDGPAGSPTPPALSPAAVLSPVVDTHDDATDDAAPHGSADAERTSVAHAADLTDSVDAVRLALASGASVVETARERVERIRELCARYPGALPARSEGAARHAEPALGGACASAVAPSPGELTGRCIQRLRALKSKYQLSDGADGSGPTGAIALGVEQPGALPRDADQDPPTPSHSAMTALRERLARINTRVRHENQ